ncbi:hypothetical protein BBP40_005867 [Aspergillus hancockii]|nr:hypothetical protein BBP40_005867 [Aspergillus hancockii]
MNNVSTFSTENAPSYEKANIQVEGITLEIDTIYKKGKCPPIRLPTWLRLLQRRIQRLRLPRHLSDYGLLAYDAPGCGDTTCPGLSKVNIPFLVKTAKAMLDHYGISKIHLSGHSMGGLTALLLASETPDRVLSFVNIKGNLASEDCFLSRQVSSSRLMMPSCFSMSSRNGPDGRLLSRMRFMRLI